LGVFLRLFYQYSWTGQRQFQSLFGILLYYAVPLAVAGFLFASLWISPAAKVNLLTALISVAATIYWLELFIWAYSPGLPLPAMNLRGSKNDRNKVAAQLSKKFGVDIDTRSVREVIAGFRKEGVDAVPIVTPSNHLFVEHPDGSITSAIEIDGQ